MNQDIYVVVEHVRGEVTDITYVMVAAARNIAQATGGGVVGLLLGHNAQSLADKLAVDRVIYLDHPALADFTSEAYQKAICHLISSDPPRAILFGHTTIGMDIAGLVSIRMNLPVVSQCQQFSAEAGTIKFISQICGGKIMAEGALPEPTALVTMVPGGYKPEQGQSDKAPALTPAVAPDFGELRVSLKGYIEPEAGDVDISREPLLIAVGRGIQTQDNIVLAEDLAQAVGGVVCASRPVVDQGWLPTSRLVGKSGKVVKPKVYLAIGISGAPEHVEAITSSETIIAINSDSAAPIFNIAKYGIIGDLFELVPALTEEIQRTK